MKNDFLIVSKAILPSYYEDVIKAREEIERKNISVSEAVKRFNISRSTYYKYKDYIFKVSSENVSKVMLSFKTIDEVGVLKDILDYLAHVKVNVVEINQDAPINKLARININIDIAMITSSLDDLINGLREIKNVNAVDIVKFN